MTELEKIAYAKSFIDKLSLGIDPTTGQPVSHDDVVFNPRISKCFSYVSDILQLLIVNNGSLPSEYRVKKSKFRLDEDKRSGFRFSDYPIPISEFCDRVSELADLTVCRKLPVTKVCDWLVKIELLEVVHISERKTKKIPTRTGFEMGISTEERVGMNGPYTALLYSRKMQEFMLDNLDDIIAFVSERSKKTQENRYER